MSHAAADRIERPEEMALPDEHNLLRLLGESEERPSVSMEPMLQMEDETGRSGQILNQLKPEGVLVFTREIVAAVYQSHETGDLRPVQDVIEAWYRTLRFVSDPQSVNAVNAQLALAATGERRIYELDEIRDRLGLSD